MADLLAKLVPRLAVAPEPTTTLAVECILSSAPAMAMAQGFVDAVAGQAGTERFTVANVAAEAGDTKNRPDLTFWSSDDLAQDQHSPGRLLVEHKFWAGLTEAQPVGYLRALPKDGPSMLLFAVPNSRVDGIWKVLKERCADSKIALTEAEQVDEVQREDGSSAKRFRHARDGSRTLAVTSWSYVVDTLKEVAQALGDTGVSKDVLANVEQLRRLTDRFSGEEEFLPLQDKETADVRVAQRLVNYVDLIGDVVANVDGASTDGLRPRHGWHSNGRYFAVNGREGWLGIDRKAWRTGRRTPLWIRFWSTKSWGHVFNDLKAAFPDGHFAGGWFRVPVPLTAGVERDTVVEDAVRHVEKVFKKLDEFIRATAEQEADESENG